MEVVRERKKEGKKEEKKEGKKERREQNVNSIEKDLSSWDSISAALL